MATYNNAKYISEQIDSLLNQTHKEFTLFIRDDGSTDTTCDIIKSYVSKEDKIIEINDTKGNLGPQGNFIELLNIVESDYYMFCDADDIWMPNKIEEEFCALQQIEDKYGTKQPALIYTDLKMTDGNMDIISESYWKSINHNPRIFNSYRDQAYNCYVTGCTMMFNKQLRDISLYPPTYSPMHDWWIATQAYRSGGIVKAIEHPLMYYRKHGMNATGDFVGSQKGKTIGQRLKELRNQYKLMKECNAFSSFISFLLYKYRVKHIKNNQAQL